MMKIKNKKMYCREDGKSSYSEKDEDVVSFLALNHDLK